MGFIQIFKWPVLWWLDIRIPFLHFRIPHQVSKETR